jgi:hypothetical protein
MRTQVGGMNAARKCILRFHRRMSIVIIVAKQFSSIAKEARREMATIPPQRRGHL